MTIQRYSDQQVPLNSKIHNSLRRPNPPILENTYHLGLASEVSSVLSVPPWLNFLQCLQHPVSRIVNLLRLRRCSVFMDDSAQSSDDTFWIGILPHVPAISDPRRASIHNVFHGTEHLI